MTKSYQECRFETIAETMAAKSMVASKVDSKRQLKKNELGWILLMELLHVHHLIIIFFDFNGIPEQLLRRWTRGNFSLDIARNLIWDKSGGDGNLTEYCQ